MTDPSLQDECRSNGDPLRLWIIRLAVASVVVLAPAWMAADWWSALPVDATATYVGRSSCIDCHSAEYDRWQNSHHDLAMDIATDATVLGDFQNAELSHFGIRSRMFRRDGRFFVNTEGSDGSMQDFEIKYVFGVEPLQQYLVEFDRPTDMPAAENSRLQVLRISWDTERQRWFYLPPPDVDTKLEPNDPLHWTGTAQNWNHMCANCHSTNLKKNFTVATRRYHTTFTDIDVSCESCHGPGSLHVKLATARSLFWDRKRGYALRRLKTSNNQPQVETCAPCHSRRRVIAQCNGNRASYYDVFENELIRPETYYADGQIRDEVYVFGSFLQSKMYDKGVRCSDCHDPHSLKLLHSGNQLCTSCHQHPAAKYDTPAHHNHAATSTGASCVECHMPATPFMEIDLRRDHSLRVPRPDLSVKLGTPNACTGCHLDADKLPAKQRRELRYYSDWLAAVDAGNSSVRDELQRLDQWAAHWFEQWYGRKPRPHFAEALAHSWNVSGDPQDASRKLADVVQSRDMPSIARASALWQLFLQQPPAALPLATRLVSDRNPQLRATALRCLQAFPPNDIDTLVKIAGPRLSDSVRLVRIEAANLLAGVPRDRLRLEFQKALNPALDEYRQGLLVNSDQAGAHLALGILAERLGRPDKARAAYEAAIHVQPAAVGPRSNLAQLLHDSGDTDYANQLQKQELKLLERDAHLAPDHAAVQYRYALSLFLNDEPQNALPILVHVSELEPDNPEYRLTLALLHERLENWREAFDLINQLVTERPQDVQLLPILQRLQIRLKQPPQRTADE